MTEREKYLKDVGDAYAAAAKILTQRSLKYAPEDDPFANIREASEIADTDVEQSIMTRFGDKVGRIRQCLRERRSGELVGTVDESLDDSLLDAINYLVMLRVWIRQEAEDDVDAEYERYNQASPNEDSQTWFDKWRNKFN